MLQRKNSRLWLIFLLPIIVLVLWAFLLRPDNGERLLAAAQQAMATGQPLLAAEHFAAAAEYFPNQPELWSQAAAAALQGGDSQVAIAYLERMPKLTSQEHFLLGKAYYLDGDLDRAVAQLDQVILSSHGTRDVYHLLLQIHRMQRDYIAVQADLQSLLLLAPNDVDYNYQLGLLFAALQPESAMPYLDIAAQLDPALASAYMGLADALRTSRIYHEPAYTYLASGRVLASLGEWELAAEAFRRAVEQDDSYGEAWAYLGEAHQQLGEDGATDIYQALLLSPDSVAVNLLAASYWQREGDYNQAMAYLDVAVRLDPDNPVIQAEIGNTLSEKGDLPLAEAHYRKAIELAPGNPAYYRLLAGFALRHDIQLHEMALPAARKAILLEPNDLANLKLMAQVLLRLGDPLTAEHFLLQALRLDPDDPATHFYLGHVYWLRDEKKHAQQEWQRTLELAPNSIWAKDAEKWLLR